LAIRNEYGKLLIVYWVKSTFFYQLINKLFSFDKKYIPMKIRTILCLVFFVSYFTHAAVVSNPIIPTLSDLVVCDNDGIAIFDLTNQSPIILAAHMDLSELKSGNYFVKVSSGTKSRTLKIVKE
jgi:hypothetical protein